VERVIVGGVNVRLGGWYNNFDLIRILACLDDTEIRADFVVTFCAPRHVMHVGKLSAKELVSGTSRSCGSESYRIHVQNVDVSGRDQKVLDKGGDHMPRFKLPLGQFVSR